MGKPNLWFDELYLNNANKLVKVAEKILRNRSVAEELVQDVFLVLLMKQDEVKRYEHPEAFLWDVLRKRIGNEMQKASYSREEPLEEKHEAIVARDVHEETVQDILPDWLNDQERQILIWRVEDGLSHQEIACRLGCSEHACHGKMYRLREKFKKHGINA